MSKPQRMWINQPSTLQPRHDLHGTNVLACHEYDDTWCVYFLSGNTISTHISRLCLSPGWVSGKPKQADALMVYAVIDTEQDDRSLATYPSRAEANIVADGLNSHNDQSGRYRVRPVMHLKVREGAAPCTP